MFFPKMWLSIVVFVYSVQFAMADCNHDNCLRAVIGKPHTHILGLCLISNILLASAFPTRSGAADCASYLLVTVTPVTV